MRVRWVPILAVAALSISTVCRAESVLLRYRYKPDLVMQFAMQDVATSMTRVGNGPEKQDYTEKTTGVSRKTIVSAKNGEGVIEEVPVRGSIEHTDSRGTTTQLMPAVKRRFTFDAFGKVLRIERFGADGKPDTRPQPLDGFAFALPQKPVSPGATWSEQVQVVGLDGKPMTVKASSTYKGLVQRAGHAADQVEVTFAGDFKAAGANAPVDGTVKGAVTYFLARDLGQEVDTHVVVIVAFSGTIEAGGTKQPFARTVKFDQRRTLLH